MALLGASRGATLSFTNQATFTNKEGLAKEKINGY
jgi:hypothetical protein